MKSPMATSQDQTRPIFSVIEEDEVHHLLEQSESGCSCFGSFSCFGKSASSLREFSEVAAGPTWKNLLRKIGGYFTKNNKRKGIQYDSFEYALNFDEGLKDEEEEERFARGFSVRFAPPVYHDKDNTKQTRDS